MFKSELDISRKGFESDLSNFLTLKQSVDEEVVASVTKILKEVSSRGDSALIELTKKFDDYMLENFFLSQDEINASFKNVNKEVVTALEVACENIIQFHSKCRDSLNLEPIDSEISRTFRPIRSALLYVPGGKASYPSSV